MFSFTLNLLLWFPWLNFYSESAFLQVLIITIFYFFITSTNLFYAAFSLFSFILLIGIFLAYYNLEVLTGFLLVVEFTAFFIILLFLLSMNFEALIKNGVFSFFIFSLFILITFLFFIVFDYQKEYFYFLNPVLYLDDFYEILSNSVSNDIFGLYLSYYFINSFLFFLFFFLIFIASLICIMLVKVSKFSLYNSTLSFSYIFDFFKNITSFDFLRKQSMLYQNKRKPVTKLIKFSKLNVAEK